jgi:hypothetical protein
MRGRIGIAAGQCAGPGKPLERERKVEVADVELPTDFERPPGVVQRRFGPAKHAVDPGYLPLAPGEVDRLAEQPPQTAGGMSGVDHPVLFLRRAFGLVEQLPCQVVEVGAQLLLTFQQCVGPLLSHLVSFMQGSCLGSAGTLSPETD